MTEREAYDGAWDMNLKLPPRTCYAEAELLPAIGNHDRWRVKVYVYGLPPVYLDEPSEVKDFIDEALKR